MMTKEYSWTVNRNPKRVCDHCNRKIKRHQRYRTVTARYGHSIQYSYQFCEECTNSIYKYHKSDTVGENLPI